MNHQDYRNCTPACTTPPFDAQRSMIWQAICGGAQGIFMYSFFDMKKGKDVPFEQQWSTARTLAEEVRSFAPTLLSDGGQAPTPVLEGENVSSWLRLRAQWVDTPAAEERRPARRYVLFAVSNGAGEGPVSFSMAGIATAGIANVTTLTHPRRLVRSYLSPVHPRASRVLACVVCDTRIAHWGYRRLFRSCRLCQGRASTTPFAHCKWKRTRSRCCDAHNFEVDTVHHASVLAID